MSQTKLNRNAPCACGSGKKYKHCCLSATESLGVRSAAIGLPIQDTIEAAMSHHREGHLVQAEDLYLQVLQIQPDHPDALHLLGAIAHQNGDHDRAIELIDNAIKLQPSAAMYGNMALAVQAKGNLDRAIRLFRHALSLSPEQPSTYNNLGIALQAQGKLPEAIEYFLHAISLKPDYSSAYCNLGVAAYDLGHLDEAIKCYQMALSIEPNYAVVCNNLGNAFRDRGMHDEAIKNFEMALALDPGYVMAYNNLGNAIREQGQLEIAIEYYRKTLTLDPNLNDFHSNLLFTLLSASSYNPEEVFAEHLRFSQQFEAPLKPSWLRHDNLRDKHKRLKVGYVSGDFRNHAVASYFEPTLASHDRSQVDVFCYYNHHQHDEVTSRLAALSDHWIPCKGMSDTALAERIRQDGIDILVDLSGHTAYNRLLAFARKPAPVQITWMGYPSTTGLAAMDYRLTDAGMDPPGMTEHFNSETLLRLPASCQFNPAATRPPINGLPALTLGTFTLACLNNLTKISEQAIALWAQILLALPHARLMLGNVNDLPTRQKMANTFAKYQIAEERLVMHSNMPLGDFLALHHQIDLALDPFPFNGGTTSLHALSMGVPVITLAGNSPVTRSGASIMGNAGLPEFVTSSQDEYVQRAIEFASDLPRLDRIRQSLPERLSSPSHPGQNFTRHLEEAFRQVWAKWCDSQ
jgi:protein O-GlcNAc transferase